MKQKFFALAVMMALVLIGSVSAFAATLNYDATLNGHKYKIFNTGMTWDNAKTYCERLGGHLVTITSFAEQQVVEKLLREKGNKNSYWAGAYRSNDGREYKPGQRFKWLTGEVSDFNNFSANQPDNFQGNEDALMIYRNIANNRLGAWNDIKKDGTVNTDSAFGINNFGFICEWDSASPTPVTNIKGDANCDGRVDVTDAVEILNYHNGKTNNLKSTTNADVTKDGRIDESDSAIVKLIAVGVKIPDSFDGYTIESNGRAHIYKVYNNGMTWQQARDYCKNQGGHLVTITSQDEQGEINRRIQLNGNKNSYWIGGCKSGGTWKWITGEAVSYTHMAGGQPDGDGNALMIYRKNNPIVPNATPLGSWNDIRSDGTCNGEAFFGANNFGFICEWDTAQDRNIVMDTPEGKIATPPTPVFKEFDGQAIRTVSAYTDSARTNRNGNERVDQGDIVRVLKEEGTSYYVNYPAGNQRKERWVEKSAIKPYTQPIPPSNGVAVNLNVPLLKQSNPEWSGRKISTNTIGNIGCTVTSLAMKYNYHQNANITPVDVVATLKSNNGFSGNSIVYAGVKKAFGYNNYIVNNKPSLDNSWMKIIYDQLKANNPVIIGAYKNSSSQHWVIVKGYTGNSATNFNAANFQINDPQNNFTTLQQFINKYNQGLRGIIY